MIGVGIFGLGHAAGFHAAAIQTLPEFTIRGVCDVRRETLTVLPGIPFYESQGKLLAADGIDALIIATPAVTHYDLAHRALLAAKHVLLEKPATADPEQLADLAEIAKSVNRSLGVALHASFGGELAWFRRAYRNDLRKRLGPITTFRCRFYDPYVRCGQLHPSYVGLGGSWLDSGVNALSALASLIDLRSMKPVSCTARSCPHEPGLDICTAARFGFSTDSNQIGYGWIHTRWDLGVSSKTTLLRFANSPNRILLDHTNQRVVLLSDARQDEVLADFSRTGDRMANHYKGLLQDFARSTRDSNTNTALMSLVLGLISKARTETLRVRPHRNPAQSIVSALG